MNIPTLKRMLRQVSALLIFVLFAASGYAQSCPNGYVAHNGGCKALRTSADSPPVFNPVPIRDAENVMLYPLARPTYCNNGSNDSTCAVVYTYTNPNPPAVISASWSNTAPVATQDTTTLTWTSQNAASMTISCTGVGGAQSGSVALQGSSNAFSATAAGVQSCLLSANNSIGETTSMFYSVSFAAAPPVTPTPVLSVTRANGLPMKYPGTTGSTWSTTNATTLTFQCTSSNGGYTAPLTNMALSGSTLGATLSTWVGKTSVCTWTATGAGGTTVVTETLTTTAAGLVPVYLVQYDLRFLLTRDLTEVAWHVTNWNATNHGIAFYAFANGTAIPGLTAVHKYMNVNNSSYFYTSHPWEVGAMPSHYSYRGIAWYGQYNSTANGVVPLNRFFWNSGWGYHYFTRAASGGTYNIPQTSGMYVWP